MTPYLCELCFEQYTTHMTEAWDGLATAVCDDCLAPPAAHEAWEAIFRWWCATDGYVREPQVTSHILLGHPTRWPRTGVLPWRG